MFCVLPSFVILFAVPFYAFQSLIVTSQISKWFPQEKCVNPCKAFGCYLMSPMTLNIFYENFSDFSNLSFFSLISVIFNLF